ncbi:photoreceptor ankyrin repeat protein [Protopterus annectens]|uniref:photoreceptor ankyrin repeat protein n=1 Tax=Protopterus annectens TaxID=7888 RepID=UPI001CFC2B41|nr:photoreceptor ankyrin repeat protein [Protopterus annectens]
MVACYRNFIDVVVLLSHCPYLDINHQDNDGNTPLMIAAQAGHVTVVTYLLNYYPEIHIEQTDNRGFTALIKAAMQGRTECVTALLMAGACLNAIDLYRGKTAKEWALITGRFETFVHINRLIQRPCAEQFCDKYIPEWPQLKDLVAKATAIKTRRDRLSEKLRSAFSINFPHDPEDNGVMDHAVRITTSLSSPFITTACQTICPSSPPALGKRRFAVPEIVQQLDICKKLNFKNEARKSADSSSLEIPSKSSLMSERRTNIFSVTSPVAPGMGTSGGMSFIPTRLMRRNSIFPDDCIPKIKLIKASPPTRKKDKKQKTKNKNYLEPPKWRYKELKEEKKRAEELEEERKEKEAKKNK